LPPWPVPVAGYAPPRPEVTRSTRPLHARAVVLEQGRTRFGLVSLEVMNMPEDIAAEIRERSGLTETWVVPTHTHSSFGAYDRRWFGQVFNVGRFQEAARRALVDGALAALKQAQASAAPAELEVASGEAPLSVARSGAQSDPRLTRVRFLRDGAAVAQWWVLAAHPTLVSRQPTALDPDYPGAVAGDGPTLVLQGAMGDASPSESSIEAFAPRVTQAFEQLAGVVVASPRLDVARVEATLPQPDASRMAPGLLLRAGYNFAGAVAPKTAPIGALRLGPLSLIAMPGEISFASAKHIERDGARVLSLVGSYIGYVEPPEIVDHAGGESRRQYYDRSLVPALAAAAAKALDAAGGERVTPP
jgi:neutral ceramidase